MLSALADLLLPSACAGCELPDHRLTYGVCPECISNLESLRPGPTRPSPAPAGLPPCFALGEYADELRGVLLAYKELGRHRLAKPLGALLAEVVLTVVPAGKPIALLYVPDTAAAARARFGDHMRRLARHTGKRLQGTTVVDALRARPGDDSVGLSAADRKRAAADRFVTRITGPLSGDQTVVLIDDIITTGQTMAAACAALGHTGIRVDICVTLAATQRRFYSEISPQST